MENSLQVIFDEIWPMTLYYSTEREEIERERERERERGREGGRDRIKGGIGVVSVITISQKLLPNISSPPYILSHNEIWHKIFLKTTIYSNDTNKIVIKTNLRSKIASN